VINPLDFGWSKRILDPSEVVLRLLLERNAREAPDEVMVTFEEGESWSHAKALRQAYVAAHVLRDAGVNQGSVVGVALPNGAAYLQAWWGAAVLGATIVPIDIAFRGTMISHLLRLAQPAVIVAMPAVRQRLNEAEPDSRIKVLDPGELRGATDTAPRLERPIQPWDAICLCMTSGTTGPSKLVRISYSHCMHGGSSTFNLWGRASSDVYLCDIALTHAAGIYATNSCIANRNRIAVRSRPQLDCYWEVARDAGATFCQIYSTMVTYLDSLPLRGTERSHNLRLAVTLPYPPDAERFKRKFGFEHLLIAYGSTEAPAVVSNRPGFDLPKGAAGRLLPGWQLRLADENDLEVPVGEVGEALVRCDVPWLIATEYINNSGATAEVWRNGWFHTGDLLRQDALGNFYFVDRAKDCVRRRGKNISSVEVEAVVRLFRGIADCAVVAERSGVDVEDEVKAWVVSEKDATIDFADLLAFCVGRMPHFMVPRYFETISEFPKSISAKVRKVVLRERGNSAATWDRVACNLEVTRRTSSEP
jgi:crotonobetaine/carnitine-CoA ligase